MEGGKWKDMDNIQVVVKHMKKIRNVLSEHKIKMTIYILGVLWTAVVMQLAVNSFFRPDSNLLEAFSNANSQISEYEMEVIAQYGNGFFSEEDKKACIQHIANELNLQLEDIIVSNEEDRDIVYMEKKGKNAETLIKIVSIQNEDDSGLNSESSYIIVRLTLYRNLDSILAYRDLLENIFEEMSITEIQTTMQLSSKINGKLTLDEMNTIGNRMIDNLQGKIVYENRSQELFTLYAYSGLLEEYITSLGSKINIHVAIDYDEEDDITNVYLGTPVIHGGY